MDSGLIGVSFCLSGFVEATLCTTAILQSYVVPKMDGDLD